MNTKRRTGPLESPLESSSPRTSDESEKTVIGAAVTIFGDECFSLFSYPGFYALSPFHSPFYPFHCAGHEGLANTQLSVASFRFKY